ncbi:MAG TPA: hypothetical protein VFP12_03545 [Allosphingosinicella sp.]|nr:hypothetical protein [Allosphingosinicella sp.]
MKTLHTLALGLACGAVLCALVYVAPPARRAVFCSEIVNPYELTVLYVVTVPASEHQRFNDDFIRFAQARGLGFGSGSYRAPDADGGPWYLNRKVTACDGKTFAWSSNIARADEFVVTFHYNRLFGSRETEEITDAFVAEFRPRYKIETEDDDLNRRPVR